MSEELFEHDSVYTDFFNKNSLTGNLNLAFRIDSEHDKKLKESKYLQFKDNVFYKIILFDLDKYNLLNRCYLRTENINAEVELNTLFFKFEQLEKLFVSSINCSKLDNLFTGFEKSPEDIIFIKTPFSTELYGGLMKQLTEKYYATYFLQQLSKKIKLRETPTFKPNPTKKKYEFKYDATSELMLRIIKPMASCVKEGNIKGFNHLGINFKKDVFHYNQKKISNLIKSIRTGKKKPLLRIYLKSLIPDLKSDYDKIIDILKLEDIRDYLNFDFLHLFRISNLNESSLREIISCRTHYLLESKKQSFEADKKEFFDFFENSVYVKDVQELYSSIMIPKSFNEKEELLNFAIDKIVQVHFQNFQKATQLKKKFDEELLWVNEILDWHKAIM